MIRKITNSIQDALTHLQKGGVLIFPTDTQWAISCDAFNQKAIEEIYRLKKRPKDKPLIWMTDRFEKVQSHIEKIEKLELLAKKHWPGNVTLIFPIKNSPQSIGIRIPKNSTALELLSASGILATTSANESTKEPIKNADEAFLTFPNVLVLNDLYGEKSSQLASTIVTLDENGNYKILRQGTTKII